MKIYYVCAVLGLTGVAFPASVQIIGQQNAADTPTVFEEILKVDLHKSLLKVGHKANEKADKIRNKPLGNPGVRKEELPRYIEVKVVHDVGPYDDYRTESVTKANKLMTTDSQTTINPVTKEVEVSNVVIKPEVHTNINAEEMPSKLEVENLPSERQTIGTLVSTITLGVQKIVVSAIGLAVPAPAPTGGLQDEFETTRRPVQSIVQAIAQTASNSTVAALQLVGTIFGGAGGSQPPIRKINEMKSVVDEVLTTELPERQFIIDAVIKPEIVMKPEIIDTKIEMKLQDNEEDKKSSEV